MGLLNRVKAAALFGCLLFSSFSFAQDYFWSDGVIAKYSPTDFCNAAGSQLFPGNPSYSRSEISFPTETRLQCAIYIRINNGPEQFSGTYPTAERQGDGCSAGKVWNPTTGMCALPDSNELEPGDKCEDQTGATAQNPFIWDGQANQCVKFFDAGDAASCKYMGNTYTSPGAYTVAGNLDSGGQAVAPPTFSGNALSCQVKTISSSECTINPAGAISCNVMGTFTGEINGAGTTNAADALCPDGKCPVKEPLTTTKDEGCTPVGNGSGGSTCTQEKETVQEGTQQCGLVNGAYKCVTKPPYSNGIKTTITATSETLPDGSVKVTTVKDSANTVCTDVKTCTTQNSTTTTHSTTKPNGSTSTDTSCKGVCTPNGGGLETKPGAGSGNPATGNGNGGNGEGEGGDEGTADTTDNCAVPPPCDGDPFQCAILKQAHIDTCKLMADATAEQKADAQAKTDAAYASLDAHQAKLDSDVNGLLTKFQSETTGNGSSGKCLPDKQFAIAGHTLELEFSKTCESISWVRMVLLAGAYLIAARIVSREV